MKTTPEPVRSVRFVAGVAAVFGAGALSPIGYLICLLAPKGLRWTALRCAAAATWLVGMPVIWTVNEVLSIMIQKNDVSYVLGAGLLIGTWISSLFFGAGLFAKRWVKLPPTSTGSGEEKVRFRTDDSGSAYAWAVCVLGIFALTLIWLLMTPAVYGVTTAARGAVQTTINNTTIEYSNANALYDNLAGIWRWLPLIYGLGLIAWAIIYSAVREAGRWQ